MIDKKPKWLYIFEMCHQYTVTFMGNRDRWNICDL